MKFFYSDSLDYVDPKYNFVEDRHSKDRRPYWDDYYPHELLGYAPYHGILISKGIVGGKGVSGKYTESQARRLQRVGAREFLRLNTEQYKEFPIFGDCGAFTYHKEESPPYSPAEIAEFYDDVGFTHGCSVDHIIFDYYENESLIPENEFNKIRYDITLENAEVFLKESKHMRGPFCPVGVIQAWSPDSIAQAAKSLVNMGYNYIALGGAVPLNSKQIKTCINSIRNIVPDHISLHILGFAKAESIHEFPKGAITSFDTTSPLIRAFKDRVSNYYLKSPEGKIEYYTAIRVPQSTENNKLKNLAKKGALNQESLKKLEQKSLKSLRYYDKGIISIEETLEDVIRYSIPAEIGELIDDLPGAKVQKLRDKYYKTLNDRPWKKCTCPVCKELSIEVLIFRGSNRNKRRGIHNLSVYVDLINQINSKNNGR